MDSFDIATAPPEYLEIKWITDIFAGLEALGWTICYISMTYQSFREETYGMAIIPLCSNMAWELVYSFIYPPKGVVEKIMIRQWAAINCALMYAAIKFAPREWSHAPLVARNIKPIFAIGVFYCVLGQLALAKQIGDELAIFWGALACQIFLSIGGLGQLLARGSTRGGSYVTWLGRFMGTNSSTVVFAYRLIYWPEAFEFIAHPMMQWCLLVQLSVDLAYGIAFYCIRRQEKAAALAVDGQQEKTATEKRR